MIMGEPQQNAATMAPFCRRVYACLWGGGSAGFSLHCLSEENEIGAKLNAFSHQGHPGKMPGPLGPGIPPGGPWGENGWGLAHIVLARGGGWGYRLGVSAAAKGGGSDGSGGLE